jgi:hypothetical protein
MRVIATLIAAPPLHRSGESHRLASHRFTFESPVPQTSITRSVLGPDAGHDAVAALLRTGALATAIVDGVRYLWPAAADPGGRIRGGVRFLAPFDPLV